MDLFPFMGGVRSKYEIIYVSKWDEIIGSWINYHHTMPIKPLSEAGSWNDPWLKGADFALEKELILILKNKRDFFWTEGNAFGNPWSSYYGYSTSWTDNYYSSSRAGLIITTAPPELGVLDWRELTLLCLLWIEGSCHWLDWKELKALLELK